MCILFLSIFFYSCGGVIGNIKKYRFENISLSTLKTAVHTVNVKHPDFRNFDTSKFKEGTGIGDGDYYCRIKENGQDYFFQYAYVQYDPPNNTFVEIALTSAAKYGEDLDLAKDIDFLKKDKYDKLFEKYFISEVRKELQK